MIPIRLTMRDGSTVDVAAVDKEDLDSAIAGMAANSRGEGILSAFLEFHKDETGTFDCAVRTGEIVSLRVRHDEVARLNLEKIEKEWNDLRIEKAKEIYKKIEKDIDDGATQVWLTIDEAMTIDPYCFPNGWFSAKHGDEITTLSSTPLLLNKDEGDE